MPGFTISLKKIRKIKLRIIPQIPMACKFKTREKLNVDILIAGGNNNLTFNKFFHNFAIGGECNDR
jgi:hypothetical protein